MAVLTEKTMIPIGVAIVVIGGGSMWLAGIANAVTWNTGKISSMATKQEQYNADIAKIRTDIALIKQRLGVKEDE